MMSAPTWQRAFTEGYRFSSDTTFRSWRVINTKSLNKMGRPRSYHLIPGSKGSFRDGQGLAALQGDFFVTRYHGDEYPYTSKDPRKMLEALQGYLDNEKVVETDLVVWYRLGFAHHPRTEDYSAQPVVWHHFELMPRDFLDGSPLTPAK